MFEIYIDKNGYYMEGDTGKCVKVKDMPSVSDVRYLQAYMYDDATKTLNEDADKIQTIKEQIEKEVTAPSNTERLDALESAMLDMIAMVGGGSDD